MNASDVLQRFGELPFQVELEVGSLSLSIGEIFDLKEGMVLRTEHPAGVPFHLLAAGVKLADAELVVVDESVSARVKKLALKPKPAGEGDGAQ